MKKVLLVDDDVELSQSLINLFDPEKYSFHHMDDGQDTANYVKQNHEDLDLVMLDVNLPSCSGLDVLKNIKDIDKEMPVIVISGFVSTENAMEAMREGAYEYLTKPFELSKLLDIVNKACGYVHDTSKQSPVRQSIIEQDYLTDEIIGQSPEIVEIAKLIGQVAKSDVSVLVFGESGTGKELVARAIHRNSLRRNNMILSVNCAALTDSLLESELFGHEKGAFTGAYFKRIGKFEQCDKGTIFLDEVADMSMLTQGKVLRVLQEKQFDRVGGNEQINIDVRVIAATNKSLVQSMKDGSFRVDLFYRLKVVSIYMPPLRDRREDIPLLVDHFIQRYNKSLGKNIRGISKKAKASLSKHLWPGNVRELENNIHTAMVMVKSDILDVEDFPICNEESSTVEIDIEGLQENYTEMFGRLIEPIFLKLVSSSEGRIYHLMQSSMEKALLSACLKHFNSNQVKASEMLGISRNTLRDRISKYGIY
ncbi:MAG: sigma-54-dependent Fis family transcriptional regulator [candidate division Zixibacteria bacterium]|nr:sigma-54-dependent Fis family transcriptional regulator [candidate division Zixibacteria bacterium]